MRFTIIVFLFGFYSCSGNNENPDSNIHPKAKILNDSAISIAMNYQNYVEAVSLLDKATQLDSNYFRAYRNKLTFQGLIKPFDTSKILVIIKNLNRLRPEDPEYYFNLGVIHFKIGDTILAEKYLNNALLHYNKILDTMHVETEGYGVFAMNRGITLILLKQEQKGKKLLKSLFDNSDDDILKDMLTEGMDKSRKEIFDNINLK